MGGAISYSMKAEQLDYINGMLANVGAAYKMAMPDTDFSISLENEETGGYTFTINYGGGDVARHHFDTSAQTTLAVLEQALTHIAMDMGDREEIAF